MKTLALFALLSLSAGCASVDKLYDKQVVQEPRITVHTFTNTVIATQLVAQVEWRTNVVWRTNEAGQLAGTGTVQPIGTNWITATVTNLVPFWQTNTAFVTVTNLVEKPAVEAAIQAGGGVLSGFLPGLGGLLSTLLLGAYHVYARARNKDTTAALTQGIETAREIMQTSPIGTQLDTAFLDWLRLHQAEAGVLDLVARLAQQVDNPAAKLAAQEILSRVQASRPAASPPTAPAPAILPAKG